MRGLFIRLRDFFGAIGDRIVVDGGDLVGRFGAALLWPFRRVAWTLQDRLIWPVSDRLPRAGGAVAVLGIVAVVAGAGVAALALLDSGGSGVPAATPASAPADPVAEAPAPEPKAPPAPTLQGATPVFEPGGKEDKQPADSEKQEEPPSTEPAEGTAESASSSPATDTIASAPAAEASTAVVPTPAGPAAIAVARRFADAFLDYETGGVEPTVRATFGETATPRLSRALLRRPPRLPAGVDVPKAKVMNVVAAPSRGPVYPVSVSLLRLGVTSELRLSMERKKNDEWRVSDVLG